MTEARSSPVHEDPGPEDSCARVDRRGDYGPGLEGTLQVASPLLTPRLALEPLAQGHAEAAFAGFADPAMYAFMPGAPAASIDELRTEFARLARGSGRAGEAWLNWIAVERAGGACIGWTQATVWDQHNASIAYATFTRYAGRGYAREATAAAIAWLWRIPTLATVVAQADVRNAASLHVVEVLGFARDVEPVASELHGAATLDYVYRLARPTAYGD